MNFNLLKYLLNNEKYYILVQFIKDCNRLIDLFVEDYKFVE